MVNSTPNKPRPGALRVRLRRVESGSGDASEELSVFCPRKNHGMTLDECAECERCESLYLDPRDESSFLVCSAAKAGGDADLERVVEVPAQPSGTVRDIMSRNVVTVRPDLSIESLLSLFVSRGISGAPVVDDDGRPIGMVSKTDLLSAQFLEGETGEAVKGAGMEITTAQGIVLELEGPYHPTTVSNGSVVDIMTPMVFSLPEGATVPQAAALMAYERVHRAPVVSVDDKVVGIVSSLDVLRWVGRSHGFAIGEASSAP